MGPESPNQMQLKEFLRFSPVEANVGKASINSPTLPEIGSYIIENLWQTGARKYYRKMGVDDWV